MPDPLIEVALDRLALTARPTHPRSRPLDLLLWRRAARRRAVPEVNPEILALLALVAGDAEIASLVPEIAGYQQRAMELGVPLEAALEIFQAYVRGVGRIASAETAVARRLLDETAAADRPRALGALLDDLAPISGRAFDLLHRVLLLDGLVDAIGRPHLPDDEVEVRAIAMVDLMGSTRYLTRTGPGELQRLVDAIFAAGQAATSRHAVRVFKHAGDGLFLEGRDVTDVADAAIEIIADLERMLPLRARGGVDAGPVLERAGDVFGLPVNVAHVICANARPGTLLATSTAAERLPRGRRARPRFVQASSAAIGRVKVATVRAATADAAAAADDAVS